MPSAQLELNGVYEAARVRSGQSTRGPWELVAVKFGKGQREITIFADNIPSGVVEKGRFRIDSILSVASKARQDGSGKWTRTETVVRARLSPVKEQSLDLFDEDANTEYELDLDMF